LAQKTVEDKLIFGNKKINKNKLIFFWQNTNKYFIFHSKKPPKINTGLWYCPIIFCRVAKNLSRPTPTRFGHVLTRLAAASTRVPVARLLPNSRHAPRLYII
jgi:hypothetical protein